MSQSGRISVCSRGGVDARDEEVVGAKSEDEEDDTHEKVVDDSDDLQDEIVIGQEPEAGVIGEMAVVLPESGRELADESRRLDHPENEDDARRHEEPDHS